VPIGTAAPSPLERVADSNTPSKAGAVAPQNAGGKTPAQLQADGWTWKNGSKGWGWYKAISDAIDKALGVKKLNPEVPLRDQALVEEPQFSSRPDKAVLQKAGADEATASKLLSLTNVELRQLAISLGEDMGQETIDRAKLSGSTPKEQVFERLLTRHSPEEIAQAVDEGQHLH
jgi:hypothetical protein